nr:MAG TPA: hypothetical protein [Caudoviricetes sp.]
MRVAQVLSCPGPRAAQVLRRPGLGVYKARNT